MIATAATRRQAHSIAFEIDAEMKKLGEHKLGMEGVEEGSWILIDYGDFVVHLFTPEARVYYALEEIWGDAPRLDWRRPEPAGTRDDAVREIRFGFASGAPHPTLPHKGGGFCLIPSRLVGEGRVGGESVGHDAFKTSSSP